jgi:maltose O-acetyltransferase
VLKGVSIGDNCIVGAGAVVTRSLPAGVTAVGIPAVQKRSANGKVGRPPRTTSR